MQTRWYLWPQADTVVNGPFSSSMGCKQILHSFTSAAALLSGIGVREALACLQVLCGERPFLQVSAGGAATEDFEDRRMRKAVKKYTMAKKYALLWREVARMGGPRRVATLKEAARARGEVEEALKDSCCVLSARRPAWVA